MDFHPFPLRRISYNASVVAARNSPLLNGVLPNSRWRHQKMTRLSARVFASSGAADSLPTKSNRKAEEKFEFDNIQDLIVSAPLVPSAREVAGSAQNPTLLEREAQALKVTRSVSRLEKSEAVNALLDLLEQKGVSSAYAFEFVRHAGDLIDDLFVEARESFEFVGHPGELIEDVFVESRDSFAENVSVVDRDDEARGQLESDFRAVPSFLKGSFGYSAAESERERRINGLLENFSQSPSEKAMEVDKVFTTLASKVSQCAEKRGIGTLVYYFQLIGLKAQNVLRVLPFTERGIDKVMVNVDFLRSLGVRYSNLPAILAKWPQVLAMPCESLAQNVDYLVGLGLTRTDIGKMAIKFPQILCRPVKTELYESVERLTNLGVKMKDVKKLVVRYPILLTDDALKKLNPLVTYLEQLGMQRKHIGTLMIRRPLMLDSDVEKDLVPMGNYLKSIHASSDDIDKILVSFPQVFGYDIEKDLRPTVLYLESLGVESGLMGKLLRRHPRLLQNRHKFSLKLDFLLNLGLEKKDLGKLIFNAPQLLSLSVVDNLDPTIKFLSSIGIIGPLLVKVLRHKPMILAHSVEGKLKPNIQFVKSLQVEQEEIGKLVTRYPQLLTLSVDRNLKPTVGYLLKLGFTWAEVTSMVKKLPSLLGFSMGTLAPKYTYLIHVMKRPRKEVVGFPQYFSYSLPNRIVARHKYLGRLSDSFSLSSVYGCSDDVFKTRAGRWPIKMFVKRERNL